MLDAGRWPWDSARFAWVLRRSRIFAQTPTPLGRRTMRLAPIPLSEIFEKRIFGGHGMRQGGKKGPVDRVGGSNGALRVVFGGKGLGGPLGGLFVVEVAGNGQMQSSSKVSCSSSMTANSAPSCRHWQMGSFDSSSVTTSPVSSHAEGVV